MRNHVSLLILLFSIAYSSFSQNVGIGTANPDASAQLDITNSAKGILIPRMATSSITSISNPAKGLLVYDSVKNQLMVNMGTPSSPDWQTVVAKSGWNLNGNNGTSASTNFIGTTDIAPIQFKVNNVKAGFIDSLSFNTSLGYRTLDSIATGIHNTANGYKSMISLTTGNQNTALGSNALRFNKTGANNTAVGMQALSSNVSGAYNTAVGQLALFKNDGLYNVAVGNSALQNNTNGQSNVAVGSTALPSNVSGMYNVGIGESSLFYNNSGSSNVAMGAFSLWTATSGSNNVAIGDSASFYSNNTSYNTTIGSGAGHDNTGNWTTMVGIDAGRVNQAWGSTFVGSSAGRNNVSGQYNTYLGDNAGRDNTNGSSNTAVGSFSLWSNNGGSSNVAIGNGAMHTGTTGDLNVAIGYNAGYYNLDDQNVFIGSSSGLSNLTGNGNVLLGYAANVIATNLHNASAIGINAKVGMSNAISLGDSTQGTTVGIGTAYPNKAGLVVNQTVGGAVHAMFGSNTTGVAIESNWPGIGFNAYYNAGRRFIANGFGGHINLDATLGQLILGLDGVGSGSAGTAGNVATFSKSIRLRSNASQPYLEPLDDGGFFLGSSTNRWISVWCTNGVVQTSDAREKKNIQDVQYGLKEIMEMRPVRYQWINPQFGDQQMLGVLAQDVKKIIPEIVVEQEGNLGIRSVEMIPVLIKGIQQQQAMIDDLNKKMDLLEQQNKLLLELLKKG